MSAGENSGEMGAPSRLEQIRAELQSQRQFIEQQTGAARRKPQADGVSSSGDATAGWVRPGGEFPRSVTMRLLLDHPEWLLAAVNVLLRRLGLPSGQIQTEVIGLIAGFLGGLQQGQPGAAQESVKPPQSQADEA